MKILLKCGHTIDCETPDKAICDICSQKATEAIEKTNNTVSLPEYMKIIEEITSEFHKANPNIKREIKQENNGEFNCIFTEPPKLLMKLFHSEGKYSYMIKNITKQPLMELKNILDNVKAKNVKAKEFRSIFGHSSLHFIVDEFFYNSWFDGSNFNFDIQCTKKRQWSYVGIAFAFISGILTLILI